MAVLIGMSSTVKGRKFELDRDEIFIHPDISSARQTGPREVVLQFANVDAYLGMFTVEDWNRLFSIRDAAGRAELEKVSAGDPGCLRLQAKRDLTANARVVGAPGANPTHLVPFDYAGHRPMLAFSAEIKPAV